MKEKKKRNTMPKNPEEYKISYKFSNNKDINQIMKECFLNCLKK